MRKIIVNGRQYRYWVGRSFEHRDCKRVTIRNVPGVGCATFNSWMNVTPRMVKTYIEWNPELIKKEPVSLEDAPKLYEANIDSILHQQNLI